MSNQMWKRRWIEFSDVSDDDSDWRIFVHFERRKEYCREMNSWNLESETSSISAITDMRSVLAWVFHEEKSKYEKSRRTKIYTTKTSTFFSIRRNDEIFITAPHTAVILFCRLGVIHIHQANNYCLSPRPYVDKRHKSPPMVTSIVHCSRMANSFIVPDTTTPKLIRSLDHHTTNLFIPREYRLISPFRKACRPINQPESPGPPVRWLENRVSFYGVGLGESLTGRNWDFTHERNLEKETGFEKVGTIYCCPKQYVCVCITNNAVRQKRSSIYDRQLPHRSAKGLFMALNVQMVEGSLNNDQLREHHHWRDVYGGQTAATGWPESAGITRASDIHLHIISQFVF